MQDQTILTKKLINLRTYARSNPVIKEWAIVLAAYTFVRIFLSLLAVVVVWNGEPASPWTGHSIFETRSTTMPDQSWLAQLLINPWFRWDTGWYLKIAALGYSPVDGSVTFPPLFPLLIRLIAPLFRWNYLLAALVIANLSCLLALYLFRAVVFYELGSEEKTNRAFILFLSFPTAFYLFSAYSEAPFLVVTLSAWLLARKEKWLWAGCLAATAALFRLQGFLLIVPFAWMLFSAENKSDNRGPLDEIRSMIKRLGQKQAWFSFYCQLKAGGWAVMLLPMAAFLGYQGWLSSMDLGRIDTAYQDLLRMAILSPWEGIAAIYHRIVLYPMTLIDWVDYSLFFIAILSGVICLFKQKIPLSLYLWSTISLILMRGTSIELMTRFSRYVLTFFPVFILLAEIESRVVRIIVVALSVFFQIFLTWLFLNWFWVA